MCLPGQWLLPKEEEKDDPYGPWDAKLDQKDWRYWPLVDSWDDEAKPVPVKPTKQSRGPIINGEHHIWL